MKRKIFKRAGTVALAALMLTGAGLVMPEVLQTAVTVSATGENETPASNFTYTEDYDGNITITKFTGTQEVVVVPQKINGQDVKVIDGWAFEGCTGVKRVVLPEGLETIEASAFANCTNLQTVYIPSTVKEIGNSAFYLCKYLTQVTIPNSVTYLGTSAFNGCQSLSYVALSSNLDCIHKTVFKNCSSLKSITLPSQVTQIEEQAFYGAGLESISLPARLRQIDKNAFQNCTGLTGIDIPASVTLLDTKAFQGCPSLQAINVAQGNTSYISQDGVLLSPDRKSLLLCPEGKEGAYTIPNTVMSTDYNAFKNCAKLTSVTLSPLMDGIYYSVFYGCTGLTNFEVTGNITSIGSYAFAYCTGLRRITIPESVTSIDTYAFTGCSALTIVGKTGSTAETFAGEHNFAFDVILPKLDNMSTLSASVIKIGEGVTVNCRASGGDNNYEYNVAYKEKLTSSWTTVQAYSSNTTVTITPDAVGEYSVRVIARDGKGTMASEVFDLSVKEILRNLSSVSPEVAQTGSTVTVTGASTGSDARQYAYYYRLPGSSEWTTLQDYSYKTSANLYLSKAGTFKVRVDVKQGSEAPVQKIMEVTAYDALKVSASLSASTVKIGSSVTAQAGATGGYGTRQYQFSVKKPNSSSWTVVQAYSAQTSLSYKPAETGSYTLRVQVKDELDNTSKKELTFQAYTALKLTASLAETTHLVNTGLKVTFSATGGYGTRQYAVFYKKKENKTWSTAMDYCTNTQATVTPKNVGTYVVRVRVKDELDKTTYKDLSVTVFAGFRNTSTISETVLKKGSSVTVTTSSTGGLGTKDYAVWYRNPNNQQWYQAQDYSQSTQAVVKPKQTGDYVVRVKARDERGKIARKDFTVRVYVSLKNTSTISADAIKYGASITAKASSTGGLGEKLYGVWYRNEKNKSWYQAQDYSANTSVSIKPKQTGTYYVRINVKDERDVIVRKTLTLTVSK